MRRTLRISTFVLFLTIVSAASVGAQTVNLMLSTMPAGKDPQRYQGYVEPKYKEFDRRSIYLTMRDGVKIAIDVMLPKNLPANEKVPTIMNMTRYWRSRQGDQPGAWFPSHGYARVMVDARAEPAPRSASGGRRFPRTK